MDRNPSHPRVASLSLEQSLLGWPAPFTLAATLSSGPPTSWMRHLYYRLLWTKPSGAWLAMVWRCEQGYDGTNGWHNFGFAELIRVEIRPATRWMNASGKDRNAAASAR
jgi:hypothetical protein